MLVKTLWNLLPLEFRESFIFDFSAGIVIVALIPYIYMYVLIVESRSSILHSC